MSLNKSGEQQRTALARALMNDSAVVLADEPTGNLDSHTGEQVVQCLFELLGERRRTLVRVTHNEAMASACSRRLLCVMKLRKCFGEIPNCHL